MRKYVLRLVSSRIHPPQILVRYWLGARGSSFNFIEDYTCASFPTSNLVIRIRT